MKDDENNPICVTLELPWLNNQHNISCIPEGIYTAVRYMSPKRGYEVFELTNVPDRDAIEIHVGNYPKDTDGCILLGLEYGDCAVGSSQLAFVKFMNKLVGVNQITLKVVS